MNTKKDEQREYDFKQAKGLYGEFDYYLAQYTNAHLGMRGEGEDFIATILSARGKEFEGETPESDGGYIVELNEPIDWTCYDDDNEPIDYTFTKVVTEWLNGGNGDLVITLQTENEDSVWLMDEDISLLIEVVTTLNKQFNVDTRPREVGI